MTDYSKGKIYKITSDETDKIYVGSTVRTLEKRFEVHKDSYKYWQKDNNKAYYYSYKILQFDNCKIELLEDYPCNDEDELRAREEYWRNKLKDLCVNHNKCFIAVDEKTYKHQWYLDHKGERDEKLNIEKKNNPEKYREQAKRSYLKNIEKRKAYRERIISCECGMTYTPLHKTRHMESKRHKQLIENKNII